jgi:hypothetical protein
LAAQTSSRIWKLCLKISQKRALWSYVWMHRGYHQSVSDSQEKHDKLDFGRIIAHLDFVREVDRDQAYERIKDLPGLTRFGISQDVFYDYYRFAWNLDVQIPSSYPEFCDKVAAELGEEIRPYLGLIWAYIVREHNICVDNGDVWH